MVMVVFEAICRYEEEERKNENNHFKEPVTTLNLLWIQKAVEVGDIQ